MALYSTAGRRRPKAPAKSGTGADGCGEQGRDDSCDANGWRCTKRPQVHLRRIPSHQLPGETRCEKHELCSDNVHSVHQSTLICAAGVQSRELPYAAYSRACAAVVMPVCTGWGVGWGGWGLLFSR